MTRAKINGIEYFKVNLTDREIALSNLASLFNNFTNQKIKRYIDLFSELQISKPVNFAYTSFEPIDEWVSEAETEVGALDCLINRYTFTDVRLMK